MWKKRVLKAAQQESLSHALAKSITEDGIPALGNLIEVGLDTLLANDFVKSIPFISTAISLYKIGTTVHELDYIKKLAVFIDEINNGQVDENSKQKYRDKFGDNQPFLERELEYILILISRYIGYKKPRWLAKLFFPMWMTK